jgi:hypothetical protein
LEKVIKVCNFLNLIDSQGRLSVTNLAVLVCLIKLSFTSGASITEMGTLLAALANYAHKRAVNATPPIVDTSALESKVEDIRAEVNSLTLKAGLKL